MRKPKHREGKEFSKGHTTNMWQSWDSNPVKQSDRLTKGTSSLTLGPLQMTSNTMDLQ